jgi:hypothetical protein
MFRTKPLSLISILSLAVSYLHRGLPPNYCRRYRVSPLSSGWVSVVPQCHNHQANLYRVLPHPQNCIVINNKFNSLRSSPRSVSNARLHSLLSFHLHPINGCSSRDLTGLRHESTHLEVGFPLRCFQRLSSPHLATLRLPLAR